MFKNFLINTNLISALFALALSPVLCAQSSDSTSNNLSDIKSNAVVFIPVVQWQKYFKNQYLNTNQNFQHDIAEYHAETADGSIQFVSERATINAQVKTTLIEAANDNNLHLQLGLVSSSVVVDHVNIFANIKKDLGFGTATLKLNVSCDQIKIDIANQNTIDANLQTQQGVSSLSELKWNLANSSITTQMKGCTEIAGFDSALKAQVEQLLQQKYVVEILQNYINSQINQTILDALNRQVTQYISSLGLNINKQIVFDQQNNIWIYSIQDQDKIFADSDLQKLSHSQSVSMLISKVAIEEIIKKNINSTLDKNIISSKNSSSLNKLTCSRLIQTFVWPSLKSLNKCFEMKIQSQVQSVKITDLQNLKISLQFGSWALPEVITSDYKSLAFFQTHIEANLKNKQATISSFNGQADSNFIKWSGRSKRISVSTIQGPLQTLLDQIVTNLSTNSSLNFFLNNSNIQQISPENLIINLKN